MVKKLTKPEHKTMIGMILLHEKMTSQGVPSCLCLMKTIKRGIQMFTNGFITQNRKDYFAA